MSENFSGAKILSVTSEIRGMEIGLTFDQIESN